MFWPPSTVSPPPRGDNTSEIAVWGETLRIRRDCPANPLESVSVYACGSGGKSVLRKLARGTGNPGEPLFARRDVTFRSLCGRFEHPPDPLLVLFDILLRKRATTNKELGVVGERGLLFFDDFVHPRLGEYLLVCLVVRSHWGSCGRDA